MWREAVLLCSLVMALVLCQKNQEQDSRIVNLQQGPVRGFKEAKNGVFEFVNVPYAKAPTGKDRYKAPLPPPTWQDTFDAVDRKIVCPQYNDSSVQKMNRQEDCLVANIYVPDTNQTNLPVLVNAHGGAFLLGWGTQEMPTSLVSGKNIIVVTFNYRLGPHGFLCLGIEEAPGNAGLKDQVALLQWVRHNIVSFGGNPDDITLMGCSAGGVSTDFLLLSNMTDGLFTKVISGSACSVNTISTQLDPLQNAVEYAQSLGFTDVTDIKALTEFYITTPLFDLYPDNSMLFPKDALYSFGPCVEKDIGLERFLYDAPVTILKSGNFKKIPVIYTYAREEGLFRMPVFRDDVVTMNENFVEYLPGDLQFESDAQKLEVADRVKEFYFGNEEVGENTILEYVNFHSDVLFIRGILRNIPLRVGAGHNDVYLLEYFFTHNGSTPIPFTNGSYGSNHCDQHILIMDPSGWEDYPVEISLIMRDLIYNFMITGNPTPPEWNSTLPSWPRVDASRSPHYSMGSPINIQVLPILPSETRARFWDDIYDQYEVLPRPPGDLDDGSPDSATLVNVSLQLWILYGVIITIK